MKLNINIKQLKNGNWAAFNPKGTKYWLSTVGDTEKESRVKRLYDIGREAQDVIDNVDSELEKLGVLNERDPHGYLA